MPPVGFETTISAGKRPKTYALDRAATGTGTSLSDDLKLKHALTHKIILLDDSTLFDHLGVDSQGRVLHNHLTYCMQLN